MDISIEVQIADALMVKADVLVLKYAQYLFAIESMVYSQLAISHKDIATKLPRPNEFLLLETHSALGATHVLYCGVVDILKFRYKQIRDFAFRSLKHLSEVKPDTQHICLTLHGANYGLDEAEAFRSEVAGLVDAIEKGLFPPSLRKITVAEFYEPRANLMQKILAESFPNGVIRAVGGEHREFLARRSDTLDPLSEAGVTSESKPLIFVAMPFDKKMDDVFHYGIRNAVNSAGFLCERVDEVSFTGDILEVIKRRIRDASLLIADLTNSNPNVYLEVGYAWGVGIPTVLLAQDAQELRFDVKAQKCIIYSGIRELEEKLSQELIGLKQNKHHGKSP
jgi:hypothetical protein